MKMKRQHVLLEQAQTYRRYTGDLSPEGCRYDVAIGAWIVEEEDTLLVRTTARKPPQTKKQDVETGEDRKSE
ncbi:MAG: hypothetical protein HYX78_14530 [Armatimonadetes bacterium]|nr:hypothetical protein [Armatimonadota bacterium]